MPASFLVPLRRVKASAQIQIDESVWKACENAMGAGPFSKETREKIYVACAMYRMVGLQYVPSNTQTVQVLKKSIQRWLEDTDRLIKILQPSAAKRPLGHEIKLAQHLTTIIKNARSSKLPTEFLASVLHLASDSGISTLGRLDGLTINLDHHFWGIWVALIGKAFEESGFKISAASLNKNKSGIPSPFVQVIAHLQDILPEVCQRRTGGDSLVKAINSARRKWKPQNRGALLYVLAGQGLQIRRGDNRITLFDDSAELGLELQRHVENLEREVEAHKASEKTDNDECEGQLPAEASQDFSD